MPLFVKIGHLEEILVPVSGTAYVEQVGVFDADNNNLAREADVVPWRVRDGNFPPFQAFLRAAYTMSQRVQQIQLNYSSLERVVDNDGNITVNGERYDAINTVPAEDLAQMTNILHLAENLVITAIELYKYKNM